MPVLSTSISLLSGVLLLSLPPATVPPVTPDVDGVIPVVPGGPQRNSLVVQRVQGNGTAVTLSTLERSDVSSMIRLRDGRLMVAFQWFPRDDAPDFNRVAVRQSVDEGATWSEPVPVEVESLGAGLAPPFDPALVPLPDGRIRMYFISHLGSDAAPGQTGVHSAVSTDGVQYKYEPGIRFTVPGRVVVDCAAGFHRDTFHIVVPDNGTPAEFIGRRRRGEPQPGGNGYHATSTDGLSFTRTADLTLASTHDRWFGNLASDGERLLFVGTGPGPWPVASSDGLTWAPDSPIPMPGIDPCVTRLKDGSWLVIATKVPPPVRPESPAKPPPSTP